MLFENKSLLNFSVILVSGLRTDCQAEALFSSAHLWLNCLPIGLSEFTWLRVHWECFLKYYVSRMEGLDLKPEAVKISMEFHDFEYTLF